MFSIGRFEQEMKWWKINQNSPDSEVRIKSYGYFLNNTNEYSKFETALYVLLWKVISVVEEINGPIANAVAMFVGRYINRTQSEYTTTDKQLQYYTRSLTFVSSKNF